MLQTLSPEVRECLRHAEDCAQRAKIEPDPTVQRDFFDMERRWLKLARSYQYLEQISSFTAKGLVSAARRPCPMVVGNGSKLSAKYFREAASPHLDVFERARRDNAIVAYS
jgi:hypothetical protein